MGRKKKHRVCSTICLEFNIIYRLENIFHVRPVEIYLIIKNAIGLSIYHYDVQKVPTVSKTDILHA